VLNRLVKFWLLVVVLGCLPVLMTLEHEETHSFHPSFTSLLGDGALLLVAVGIGAPSIGALLAEGKNGNWTLFAGVLTILSVLLAAYGYADAATAHTIQKRVAIESVGVFVVITCLGSICSAMTSQDPAQAPHPERATRAATPPQSQVSPEPTPGD
jgi:hypothetical protein